MPNWVKNLVLLVVTTAVAVVVAEVAARQAFPDWAPRTGRLADLWDFDPDYGWAYVPGSSGPFRSHSFDTHVAINQ